MTVLAPYQVVHDGAVLGPGDTVVDVLATEADRWIDNGWAQGATAANRQPTGSESAKQPTASRKPTTKTGR